MRVLLAANESIGHNCLKILLEEKQEVTAVITDKVTNQMGLRNSKIKQLASQYRIRLYQPENINHPDFVRQIQGLKPDILFNIAFLQIYKRPILSISKFGGINFHPGPLPRYAGSNGWIWAIINGENEYGVTFHYMREEIDAGEILSQKKFPITEDDTGLSLLLRCYTEGVPLFRKTLQGILHKDIVPIPQDLTKASYYSREIPYNGIINVRWSANRIVNFVRALTFNPLPNPLSPPILKFKQEQLIVTKAQVLHEIPSQGTIAGQVIDVSQEGVIMQAGDGLVILNIRDSEETFTDTESVCDFKGIHQGSFLGI